MTVSLQKPLTLSLHGDWSVAGIAGQWALVSAYLAGLKNDNEGADEASRRILISMEGIDALDACGCQLMAIFVRDVRKIGIEPCLTAVPDNLHGIISALGFTHHFQNMDPGAIEQ
ncbi:hypothetical protein Geob_3693 [Geotalea daltonii FRC-32]|uniref:STAS domain-containing protein n=1 Tax=Geotalea daltonii (strain DSM 22248 / JCM 15807 / FRC-32) TaxID=316067 RepID=B9M711_GEODF|nr:STAS domain-containing protein [Geotalea daltonii]ACM22032.1 hypothetical protein Geob_3693 [Geotalea daltonii FRC-32]